MFLSVVVPVYNEAGVIAGTLRKINSYLTQKQLLGEIIVVDDGSTDGSAEIIKNLSLANIKLITYAKNLGKGAAVIKGMAAVAGDLLLFIDADYSTSIDELDKFFPYFDSGYDIVIGSRGLKESNVIVPQNKIKVILGRFGNKLIQLLAVRGITDTQCGFKAFNRRAVILFSLLTINRWGFDFELLYLANKFGFKTKELPVTWKNDRDSKVKWYSYFFTLIELIKIKINNLKGVYEKNKFN